MHQWVGGELGRIWKELEGGGLKSECTVLNLSSIKEQERIMIIFEKCCLSPLNHSIELSALYYIKEHFPLGRWAERMKTSHHEL